MVGHNFQPLDIGSQFLRLPIQQLPKSFLNGTNQNLQAVLGAPDQVVLERVDRSDPDAISGINHETSVARRLDIRNTINGRTAFLCPLKRAAAVFNLWTSG